LDKRIEVDEDFYYKLSAMPCVTYDVNAFSIEVSVYHRSRLVDSATKIVNKAEQVDAVLGKLHRFAEESIEKFKANPVQAAIEEGLEKGVNILKGKALFEDMKPKSMSAFKVSGSGTYTTKKSAGRGKP
jgi:hypothetical protein